MVLTLDVELHLLEEGLWRDDRTVAIQIIGKRREGLRSGKGPDGTIPFAFAYAMTAELGMAALGCSQTVRCRETFLVEQLLPGNVVLGTDFWQVEVPRDIADSLADIGRGVATKGFKELLILVPKPVLNEVSQGVGLLLIVCCLLRYTCHPAHGSQGLGIAEHIAVDSGTCILFLSSTADALLHAVLHIALPVES